MTTGSNRSCYAAFSPRPLASITQSSFFQTAKLSTCKRPHPIILNASAGILLLFSFFFRTQGSYPLHSRSRLAVLLERSRGQLDHRQTRRTFAHASEELCATKALVANGPKLYNCVAGVGCNGATAMRRRSALRPSSKRSSSGPNVNNNSQCSGASGASPNMFRNGNT